MNNPNPILYTPSEGTSIDASTDPLVIEIFGNGGSTIDKVIVAVALEHWSGGPSPGTLI